MPNIRVKADAVKNSLPRNEKKLTLLVIINVLGIVDLHLFHLANELVELLLDLCEDGIPHTQQFLKAGVGCGDLLEALDSGMSSVSLVVSHALQLLTGRGDVLVFLP